MIRMTGAMLVVAGFFAGGAQAQADSPLGYHVIKKIPIGEEGGWDYLTMDSAAHRLYISRGNRVMVVDVDEGKVVGTIPNTPGVHGIALVESTGQGFISNGGDATVTVFDTKTLKEVDRVKVGKRPDAIIYDPASNRVFTFNAGDKDSTAIDVATRKVVGKVDLGGKPEAGVSDEKGTIFVNIEDKNEIVAFDAKELAVKNRWPVAPGKEPAGLAIDRKNRRLFSTCHNQVMAVLDADKGNVVATPAIGKGTDAAAFDPETGIAFSSNGDGTLTLVKDDGTGNYTAVGNVPTQSGARTMALDTQTHNIYLVTAKGQRRNFEKGSFVVLVVGK
jgi:YVTN family beta-propeller protein